LSPVNNKKSDFGYQNAQFFEKFFDSAVRADNLHFEKRMLKYYQSQKENFTVISAPKGNGKIGLQTAAFMIRCNTVTAF